MKTCRERIAEVFGEKTDIVADGFCPSSFGFEDTNVDNCHLAGSCEICWDSRQRKPKKFDKLCEENREMIDSLYEDNRQLEVQTTDDTATSNGKHIALGLLNDFAKEVCGFDTDGWTIYDVSEAVRNYCTENYDDLSEDKLVRLQKMREVFDIQPPSGQCSIDDLNVCPDCDRSKQKKAVEILERIAYESNGIPVDLINGTHIEIDNSPKILDSGDRTEFESGAVRDMRKGKGRCDLLPLDVIDEMLSYYYMEEKNESEVFASILGFTKTGSISSLFEALRSANIYEDPYTMLLEVSKHFEEGAKKYGDDNWRKGIPANVYIDSALRHYIKWLRGDKDEPHDRAFCWNILCCIWTCVHKSELNVYGRKD